MGGLQAGRQDEAKPLRIVARSELTVLVPRSLRGSMEAISMDWPKPIKPMRLRALLRKFIRASRKKLRPRSLPEPTSDPLELAFSAFKGPLA